MAKKIELNDDNIDKQSFTRKSHVMKQHLLALKEPQIEHFSHWRTFNDGSTAVITSHPGYTVLFFKNRFYEKAFSGKPKEYQAGVIFYDDILSGDENTAIVHEIKKSCIEYADFKPDILLINPTNEYVDFYIFGTKNTFKPVHSFYLNKIDKLRGFIRHFHVSSRFVLKDLYSTPLIYPTKNEELTCLSSPNWQSIYNPYDIHLLQGSGKLLEIAKTFNLTPREATVASHLMSGHSSKEMAILLHVSPRTIEKHLAKIKLKTESRSMIHLMSKLLG